MIPAVGRHLLESTVFALLVSLLTLCLRKRGAAARHALWCIAAVKFVLPMALFSVLGATLHNVFPSERLPIVVSESLSGLLVPQMTHQPAPPVHGDVFNPLILIWLAGSVAILAFWLPKLFTHVEFLESCPELAEVWFQRLKGRAGLLSDVQLRFSESQAEPALSGFWKPIVILPRGISQRLSSAELEAVLLHELAHAKRRDNWTAAFAHALACVFWFYPLLLWIEWCLNRERELACDEMVVRCGAAPEDYVAGILKICRFRLSENVAGVSAISRSNLKKRMEVIMSLSSRMPVPQAPKFLVGTLIAIMTVVPMTFGLMVVPNVYGQAGSGAEPTPNQTAYNRPVSCVFAGVEYPEGTVIQENGGPEQMCARVLGRHSTADDPQYEPQWIRFGKTLRERSNTIVHLPTPKQIICTPTSSTQANLCSCEGEGVFSQNSVMDSPNGRLRCDQGKWVPATNGHLDQK
jgi:bla regulator protein blaR1